jgi:hypothetical protein
MAKAGANFCFSSTRSSRLDLSNLPVAQTYLIVTVQGPNPRPHVMSLDDSPQGSGGVSRAISEFETVM